MTIILKQSTAVDVMLGPFVDDSDGKTTEEALALAQGDLHLSKNGAAAAQKNDATAGTHRYAGNYMIDLNTTDTNTVGSLRLMCKESGALPIKADFQVMEEAIYDALFGAAAAGFDANQRVNIGQWLSQAVTLSTGNKPDVNVDELKDGAQSATDLKDFADAGYDPTTNTVTEVATLTGHTAQSTDNNTILAHADYGNAQLVRSTAPANKLDVSTTGEVGLDFDNIKDASAPHTLADITIPLVTTTTTAINLTNAATVGDLTADMKLSVNTESDTALSDYGANTTTPPTVNEIRDGILDDATRFSGGNVDAAISSRSSHDAAAVRTAMEATGSDLHYLMIDQVNKKEITKLGGGTKQYDDANDLIGTIPGAYTEDADTVTRLRMVQ